MSELLAIIDAYKDGHGQPSDASVARAIGVARQTMSSWRRRGIRELPERDTLIALARLANVSYEHDVLPAALADIGYIEQAAAMRRPPAPPAQGEVKGA